MDHKRTLDELTKIPAVCRNQEALLAAMETQARRTKRLRTNSAMGMTLFACCGVGLTLVLALKPEKALAFSDSLEASRKERNSKREHFVMRKGGFREPFMVEYFSPPRYRLDSYANPFGIKNYLGVILINTSGKTAGLELDEQGMYSESSGGYINANAMKERARDDDFAVLHKSLKASTVEGPVKETWRGETMFKYRLKLPSMQVTVYVEPDSRLIRFMDVFLDEKKHPQSHGRNFLHQQVEVTYPENFPEETFDLAKLKSKLIEKAGKE